MTNILIVDDDSMLSSMLKRRLESAGYTVTCTHTLTDGLHVAQEETFDVIFLDVNLPDGNGLDHLVHFAKVPSAPEIIIMTGEGDPRGAEKAIKTGAWSYLEKPHVIRDLLLPLTRALEFREQKQSTPVVRVVLKRGNIIGESSAIIACLDQLANAATGESSVLLTGETGTGKELFAKAVHENSNRAAKPFIVVDCASLPDTLIESILFGHTKGAYTGADRAEEGLIQLADGGTLFLDEVGELPFDVQKKFLRVIQEGKYRPVGSSTELYSSFRLVAATNRDLDQMSQTGLFRADLMYRLRSFNIHLPPLRERLEDIAVLARNCVSMFCDRLQIEQKVLTTDFISHLEAHRWSGNVRELYQLLEEVCSSAQQHRTLFAYHLPDHIRINQAHSELKSKSVDCFTKRNQKNLVSKPLPWKEYKAVSEKEYLIHLMAYSAENIQKACEISGISRARIYQLLKKQGIKTIKRPNEEYL